MLPAWKSSKTASVVSDAHPLENKTVTGSDILQAPIEAPPVPSGTTSKSMANVQFLPKEDQQSAPKEFQPKQVLQLSGPKQFTPKQVNQQSVSKQFQPKEDLQQSAPNVSLDPSSSPETSMPECDEAAAKSDSPPPAEDLVESRSLLGQDQSSEEHVDDRIEPEEWWESSPGFDVLVDDGSENMGYEDEPEYLMAHDSEARGLHNHLLQYDYEDPSGYDPSEYQETGILYEQGIYDSYDRLEDDYTSYHARRVSDLSKERMLDPMFFRKRKILPREVGMDGQHSLDLREHLTKHRRMDRRQVSYNPRRRNSSRLNDRRRERPERHGMNSLMQGRLASEVGKDMIGLRNENEIGPRDSHRRGWFRQSQSRSTNRSRQHEKERRHPRSNFLPSEISRESKRCTQDSATFTGPKTLAQIKEEKRKARGTEDAFGISGQPSKMTSVDFQGPKSLSEILKDKRRAHLTSDDYSSSSLRDYNIEHEGNHNQLNEEENDFVDDDEDDEDEDGFEKKIASICS
nr:TPA_asm: hypothetical protein HUJ06_003092 [Nelumbo nucifera]